VLDPDVLLRDDSAGLPGGAAALRGARAVGSHALGFAFAGGQITEIEMISEPGRLQDVDLAIPGS
jgi:hypothetical protein